MKKKTKKNKIDKNRVNLIKEEIKEKIYLVRNELVMLETDVAEFLGVDPLEYHNMCEEHEEDLDKECRYPLTLEETEKIYSFKNFVVNPNNLPYILRKCGVVVSIMSLGLEFPPDDKYIGFLLAFENIANDMNKLSRLQKRIERFKINVRRLEEENIKIHTAIAELHRKSSFIRKYDF